MIRKYYTSKQIINKLRKAEVLLGQGNIIAAIWKDIGVSVFGEALSSKPFQRWQLDFKEYLKTCAQHDVSGGKENFVG